MTRLSDDAVDILRGMARGGVAGNALGDLLDEVAALRNVAEAAKRSLDSRCAYNQEDYDLEHALVEAGR